MSVAHCALLFTRDCVEFPQQLSTCHTQEPVPDLASDSLYGSPHMAPFGPPQYDTVLPPHPMPQYGVCSELGPQSDVEMTWQELMSLTELQGLDTDGQTAGGPSFYGSGPVYPAAPGAGPCGPASGGAAEPWAPPGCGHPLEPAPCGPEYYQTAGLGPGAGLAPPAGDACWGVEDPAAWGPPIGGNHQRRGGDGETGKGKGSSRDERRAQALRLPLPADAIVRLPVEDFNELASRYRLNEQQLALARDIRRRGKNKAAAQSCRRRKLEAIARLESELRALRGERARLAAQREQVTGQLGQARTRLRELRRRLLSSLRDPRGLPYPEGAFELRQADDGGVYLVPRAGEGGGGQ